MRRVWRGRRECGRLRSRPGDGTIVHMCSMRDAYMSNEISGLLKCSRTFSNVLINLILY